MNRQQAKDIIIDTFENSFKRDRFLIFLENLLKNFEEKTFVYQGNYIPEAFRQYISLLERIGKYTYADKEIDLLIVQLRKETSLERARTMLRNLIAWYLKGSRGGKLKDAALVAFISPNQEDWRFSLVKMDYRFKEAPTGKIKVEEEFTPARRWSFLVGKNEKSHTAQSRFVPILENDDWQPTLEDFEAAFNVEVVTKEFFEKYRELFIKTKLELDKIIKSNPKVKKEFEEKNINTVDFTKKLLGQIVFLYFLQKKGWFGVKREKPWGSGPKDFIRKLFNKEFGKYQNFYNDILEPLFYEALRTDRSADDHYYRRFDCKIPFLNGGLFDPMNNFDWVGVDLLIPDWLFSNFNLTKEGDIGDGILDIFDRYNFTVNEEEPLEKEVALDPELLGKIYEKLNAIRPDNFDEYVKVLKSGKKGEETKFNKEYGVYYTPREIVHYMCQESLINYLETELQGKVPKEDIEKFIKLADFVREIEIIASAKEEKIKEGNQKTTEYESQIPDSIKANASEIDRLLSEVKICDPAVGSGAFPIGMMHEIVRLRQLISVYLGREAKSYDLKRHCIENSLYGVDIDHGAVEICKLRFWLSLIVDEEDFHYIKPLPNLDYKVVCGDSLLGVEKDLFNQKAFTSLEELKPRYFNETNPLKKQQLKRAIEKLIFEITKGHREFDFEVYFSEVFHQKRGFDIVIANPPYVKRENMNEEMAERLQNKLGWIDDLYIHFTFRAFEISKNKGVVCFITNDSFIGLEKKQRVRDLLLNNDLLKIVKCPKETFEAMIYTAIFIAKKGKSNINFYECEYFEFPGFVLKRQGQIPYNLVHQLPQKKLIFPSSLLTIYLKLRNLPKIKEFLKILDTGIHSGNVRDKIFFKEKVKPGLAKLLQGKQIEKWGIFWERPEAKYKWCDINYKPKKIVGKGRKKGRSKLEEYWHFCGSIENHHQPERLLMRQSDDDLVVAYHSEKLHGRFYTDNTLFTILPKKNIPLKYAIGLLNSFLLNSLYHFLSQEEGKILAQVKVRVVENLPFIWEEKNKDLNERIVKLVDRILNIVQKEDYLKNSQDQAKVKELEKEIDQLVYKLFDLTDEEIRIIEGATSR